MQIDAEEEVIEKDDDSVIQALIAQGKKSDASNRAVQKMVSEALGELAIAITELAASKEESGEPNEDLGKTISESITALAKTISEQKTDFAITEANNAILAAIETINKASSKSNNSLMSMVMSMQDQNKALIESLKELKGSDKYDETLQKTIAMIGKSNEVITSKINIPDYSKEITGLADAIKSRPTSFTVSFQRSPGGITAATITPKN